MEERVQTLFSLLQSKQTNRGNLAGDSALDLYTYCVESVSDTDIARCSAVLFNKQNGVLKLLRETASLDEFSHCKETLLNLLDAYSQILKDKVLPYAVEIKEVCNLLFTRDKTSRVKNAVFAPLTSILRLCVGSAEVDSLNIPKLVEKFLQATAQVSKNSATVRGGIYQLLGVLCEVYPELMTAHSERLVDVYVRTLKAEMVSKANKKPEMSIIAGCLRGLCSYLINFSQSASEGSMYAQDIYKFSRMAFDPKASKTRFEVPRAGMSLIAKHAAQFKEYMVKDHEYMYDSLMEWAEHNNKENKNCAMSAMQSFFEQVSVLMVERAAVEGETLYAVFKELMRRLRGIIDNKSSSKRQVSVAIRGYGHFAAVRAHTTRTH